ncbi:cellulose biosynthesis protein BcsD [Burkholderia ubonensis]|uniref:cellulose biosynthesis protein BcsD n=1 Tax=Burkholderia ubonensis TaxID=101571 RepID=UPI00075E8FE2|nr:cellulose synthase [Burkholderia ubonensis]KVW61214.1 cellulose synthase [Burkholderia ubonensis]
MTHLVNYLLERQLSPQWHAVLSALAGEFEAELSPEDLRQLMYRVGVRFAQAHPLSACASTGELADVLNARWRAIEWGFVELIDHGDELHIKHCCAPLLAFGPRALKWTPALLEGVYQAWFDAQGAQGLVLEQVGDFDANATVEFRLAQRSD